MARRSIFASGQIIWNEGQIRILLDTQEGEVGQDIARRARAVQKRAQRRAPMRTGRLRSSISVSNGVGSDGPESTITASAPYALMVEFGRREVRPVNKTWLHWAGDFSDVFALSAAAVPAVPFMRESLDAINE